MAARVVIVCLLIASAGIAGLLAQAPEATAPVLPRAEQLLGGTDWRIQQAYAPVAQGLAGQEWLLSDSVGSRAILFVGATSRPQTAFVWTGELGYLGEGYLVERKIVRSIALGGQVGGMTQVRIRRGDTLREIAYAVVRPDGVVASGGDEPLALGWDALSRRGELYYAVRVAVPSAGDGNGSAAVTATGLLSIVLTSLVRLESSTPG